MIKRSAFPQLDSLFDLASRDGVDVRPTLLRVLTDLYVQKPSHSAEEQAQYSELAQRLIETVDETTRAAVAARLAAYPGAPSAVFRRLSDLLGTAPAQQPPAMPEPGDRDAGTELSEAFFAAGAEERRLILINLDAAAPSASRAKRHAPETCRRLEAAALERNTEAFIGLLTGALTISRELGERIVADSSGEPLVIAAKTLGMARETLERVLLFLNPAIGQSVQRVYELASLYDEFGTAVADTMVGIWRGRAARRPAHQSVYFDDERRSARAAATPSHYSSARRTDALTARFKGTGR